MVKITLQYGNIYCIAGVAEAAKNLPDVTAVLKRFYVPSLQRHVVVDVVCCQGQTWVKVVARNNKSLTTDLIGKLLLEHSDILQTINQAIRQSRFI